MRRTGAAISLAAWALVVIFFPVVLVAGEPAGRYVMQRVRWSAANDTIVYCSGGPALVVPAARTPRHVRVLFIVMRNPLWIALTAPGRWVGDQVAARRTGRGATDRGV